MKTKEPRQRLEEAPASYLGTTPGEYSTDQSGGATYAIPITVPPGRAGMAPSLRFVYNSGGPNGLLGMGGQLSGLSQITRCAATPAQDGFRGAIKYDANDRFTLDGIRLMLASGANYVDPKATFRTEIESWQKIVPVYSGVPGRSGPDAFIVYAKDGRRLEYGTTPDAQLGNPLNPSLRTWALNKVTDLAGNYLTIEYTQAPEDSQNLNDPANSIGVLYPKTIAYTGNVNLAPKWSVDFGYEARPDHWPTYQAGCTVEMKSRLASVTTSYDGLPIRSYRLAYQSGEATGRSQLASVVEQDGSNPPQALPPTTLAWQDWDLSDAGLAASSISPWNPGCAFQGQTLPMDYNGDGLVDLVQVSAAGEQQLLQLTLIPSTGTGFGPASSPVTTGIPYTDQVLPMDVDGDGCMDLVCASQNGYYLQLAVVKGGTRLTPGVAVAATDSTGKPLLWGGRLIPMDVDGDGKVDLVYAYQQGDNLAFTVLLSNGSGFSAICDRTSSAGYYPAAPLIPLDFNGDGMTDLVYAFASGNNLELHLFLSSSSGPGPGATSYLVEQANSPLATGTALPANGTLLGLDVNGDGMGDLVQAYVDGSTLKLSTVCSNGVSFEAPVVQSFSAIPNVGSGLPQLVLADVNGDGLVDLVIATSPDGTSSQLTFLLANGAGFELAQVNAPSLQAFPSGLVPMDFDGDGRTELVALAQAGNQLQISALAAGGPFPDLLQCVTNGLNGTVEISYAPLTDTSVYSKATAVDRAVGPRRAGPAGVGAEATPPAWDNWQLWPSASGTSGASTGTVPPTGLLNSAVPGSVLPLQNALTAGTTSPGVTCCTRIADFPKYVVKSYTKGDGRGGSYVYSQAYSGALLDLTGRGWLGFTTVSVQDQDTGTTRETCYNQVFPMTNCAWQNTLRRTSDNALLKVVTIDYSTQSAIPGITQIGVCQVTHDSYTAGNSTPDLSRVLQNLLPDAYGNIQMQQDLGDGTGAPLYTQTNFLNVDNGTDWVLGLPIETVASSDAKGTQVLSHEKLDYWEPAAGNGSATYLPKTRSVWDDQCQQWLTNSLGYDDYGNQNSTTDPTGAVASLDYDADVNAFPTTTTLPAAGPDAVPLAMTTAFDYRFGVAVSQTDANGVKQTMEFDGLGRFQQRCALDPSGNTVPVETAQFGSDETGVYLETATRVGWDDTWAWQRAYLDGLGRVFRLTRLGADGVSTVIVDRTLDSLGRAASESLPYAAGGSPVFVTRTFDEMGRLVQVVVPCDGGSSTTQLDWQTCALVVKTEGVGSSAPRQTTLQLGTYSSQQLVIQITDAAGGITQFAYDALGRITQVTDPIGVVSRRNLDSLGRPILSNAATGSSGNDGASMWYEKTVLNDLKRVNTITDAAGNQIVLTFDALNRLVQKAVNGVTAASYVYDLTDAQHPNGRGRLCQVTDGNGRVQDFSYDPLGHLAELTIQTDGQSYAFQRQSDACGRLQSLGYPDGAQLQNLRNASGAVASIQLLEAGQTSPSTVATYEQFTPFGMPQKTTLGNRVVEVRSYADTGLLKAHQILNASGQTLWSKQYTWDGLNQLAQATDVLDGSKTRAFSYDGVGRLASVISGGTTSLYTCDAGGNLTEKEGISFTYDGYRAQQGTENGQVVFTAQYDAAGNLTPTWSGKVVTLGFNAERQLASAGDSEYLYDYTGWRAKKTSAGNLRTVYLSPAFEAVQFPGNLSQQTKYLLGPGGRLGAMGISTGSATPPAAPGVPPVGTQFEHHDYLGSTVLVTDPTGAVLAAYDYTPHGEVTVTGLDCARYKFTGKELDLETGFYDFGARYYDPRLGRFLTADDQTGGAPGTHDVFNRYAYAVNNPILYVDPTGHASVWSGVPLGNTIEHVGHWALHHWKPILQFAVDAALIGAGIAVLSLDVSGFMAPIATIVGGTLLGAGLGGLMANIVTAATGGHFGWRKWGIQLGVGGIGGAIGGIFSAAGGAFANSAWLATRVLPSALNAVRFVVTGGVDVMGGAVSSFGSQLVNNALTNPHHLWSGVAAATLLGAGGGLFAKLGGGLLERLGSRFGNLAVGDVLSHIWESNDDALAEDFSRARAAISPSAAPEPKINSNTLAKTFYESDWDAFTGELHNFNGRQYLGNLVQNGITGFGIQFGLESAGAAWDHRGYPDKF